MRVDLEAWIRASQAVCAIAALACAAAWCARSVRILRATGFALALAAVTASAALVELGRRQAGVPLLQPPDVGLAAAVVLLALGAALAWRATDEALRPRAAFAAGALVLAALAAQLFEQGHSFVAERAPTLRSAWLPVHAGAWSAAVALALAALLARLAARGRDAALARFARRAAGWAFAAATLGLVSGSLWSLQAWSALWAWEPKSILALLTWMALAVCVLPADHAPRMVRARGWLLAGSATVMLVSMYALWLVPSAHGSYGLHSHLPVLETSRQASDADDPYVVGLRSALALDDDPAEFALQRR
jgi:ABC-type transport system involved in cytochrome c biogenesis permease subunit